MKADVVEISEFRRTNCELSIKTKKSLNLDASIVLTSTKFRKLDDEPKRNFAAWDEISSLRLVESKLRLVKAKFRLAKRILVFQKFLNTTEYSCNHQLIAKVHVCTILINLKDRNDCYNEWFSSNRIPMFCAQDCGIARRQTLRVATKKCMAWGC